jgi:hypothetical protein
MFVCPRCHYDTNHKHHLIRHLNKKIECTTLHSQETRTNILKELIHDNDKPFKCHCGCSYSHASSFSRHKKTCTVIPSQPDLIKQVAELQAKLLQVQSNPTHITNNNNTTNNNTTNNIVIIKNNFGAENIQYLKEDHQFLQSCLSNRDVAPLIENIYCDKEHPENHTVRIRNVNHGIMEKYQYGEWNICDQDSLLTDLINRGYHILKVYAQHNKDDVIEQCCDDEEDDYYALVQWLKHDCYSDKEIKMTKKNLILVFRNNKTLLLGK